jgi:crossover junction endodeoxyribonuclease RusA
MSIIVDLPWPPSVNALWRSSGNRVHRSKRYVLWLKEAELLWLCQRPKLKEREILGEFCCSIVLWPPDKRKRDIDNFSKPALDFLQHMQIIENDYLCRLLLITYGMENTAPLGLRVTLTPY